MVGRDQYRTKSSEPRDKALFDQQLGILEGLEVSRVSNRHFRIRPQVHFSGIEFEKHVLRKLRSIEEPSVAILCQGSLMGLAGNDSKAS